MDRLTRKERACLALPSEGQTNKEIGATMGVAEQTVRSHLGHVYAKLGMEEDRPRSASKRVRAAVLWTKEAGKGE
jgi:DNA-binding NarL/FixJ family response regulator